MDKSDFYCHVRGVFLEFLESGLEHIICYGPQAAFAPAGHNGPHLALESPVRNSCHWLLAFSVGYRLSPRPEYASAARGLYYWITRCCPYFLNSGFIIRQKHGHDSCNGVIGSAWIIEALCRADNMPGLTGSRDFARAYYRRHAFSRRIGAWHRFDPNSQRYGIDSTLDHQAWFAAAAADAGFIDDARRFITACEQGSFRVNSDGRIRHLHYTLDLKARLLGMAFGLRRFTSKASVDELELAYHHYTMLPFARLVRYFPDHSFFRSDVFTRALAFMDMKWVDQLGSNRYGWPYNAPGFELPLLLMAFGSRVGIGWDSMKSILDRQSDLIRRFDGHQFGSAALDLMTLSARIYELGFFIEGMLDDDLAAETY